MTSFTSRAYAGSVDLNRLVDFAQKATGARWPRSTYMKAGDVVWTLSRIEARRHEHPALVRQQ